MLKSKTFTLILVPDSSHDVRKWTIPGWSIRVGFISGLFAFALGVIMIFDYWSVIGQIERNRELTVELRKANNQLEIYKERLNAIEESLLRVQSFATRVKIITNLESRESFVKNNLDQPPNSSDTIPPPTTQEDSLNLLENESNPATIHPVQDPVEIAIEGDKQRLKDTLDRVQDVTLKTETELYELYELLADQRAFLASLPTRRPAVGYFTNGFGIRRSPYGDSDKMHEGVDIANRPGTPIRAPANGTIAFSGFKPGYGNTIIIDHGYGLESWYAHSSRLLAKNGQAVKRGDTIAQMGSTGSSTGPHLHYEVHVNGIPVDPITYILDY